MTRRFFAPVDQFHQTMELAGPEARHLSRVLRLTAGDSVCLFNGQGNEALFQITSCDADIAQLQLLELRTSAVSSTPPLTIATAVPKGDRFSWLIEKLTELGVHRVIPLITQRSIVDPGQGKLDKVRRTIVEASKQCGRAKLMDLTEPQKWSHLIQHEFAGQQVLMAHPTGQNFDWVPSEQSTSNEPDLPRPRLVLIGPEGGFTEQEVTQAVQAGAELIRLGSNILRIETAAVAAAALAGLQA